MLGYTATSDWEQLSGDFSAWLPLLAPYGMRLIEMAAPTSGMRVLDLACGTGEPGLTLAHHHREIEVFGADRAHAMIHAADVVRQAEDLDNIHFTVADGPVLPFPDGFFDRVICRFGVMLFDNPAAGLKEIFRVLAPGGSVALSVWSGPETVQCPSLTLNVLERYTDVEWPRTYALSEEGLLAHMCVATGFGSVSEEYYDPNFTFDDLDHFLLRNLSGRFIETPMQTLDRTLREEFKHSLAVAAQQHALDDGRIRLAQEAILVRAERPPAPESPTV